jgi:hypothetical protein
VFKYLLAANALKVLLATLSIERAAEEAVPVRERAEMAHQVKPETQAGSARTPGKTPVKKQVLKSSATITTAARRILNPNAETARAFQ